MQEEETCTARMRHGHLPSTPGGVRGLSTVQHEPVGELDEVSEIRGREEEVVTPITA